MTQLFDPPPGGWSKLKTVKEKHVERELTAVVKTFDNEVAKYFQVCFNSIYEPDTASSLFLRCRMSLLACWMEVMQTGDAELLNFVNKAGGLYSLIPLHKDGEPIEGPVEVETDFLSAALRIWRRLNHAGRIKAATAVREVAELQVQALALSTSLRGVYASLAPELRQFAGQNLKDSD